MKKNAIAMLLSVVLAVGSIGAVPVMAAETNTQDVISEETENAEKSSELTPEGMTEENTDVEQSVEATTEAATSQIAGGEFEQEQSVNEDEEASELSEEADAGLTSEKYSEEEPDQSTVENDVQETVESSGDDATANGQDISAETEPEEEYSEEVNSNEETANDNTEELDNSDEITDESTSLIESIEMESGKKEAYGDVSIVLNKTSIILKQGESFQLKATVSKPIGDNNNYRVSWAVDSSYYYYCDISSDGLVTAKRTGCCTVEARVYNEYNNYVAEATCSVMIPAEITTEVFEKGDGYIKCAIKLDDGYCLDDTLLAVYGRCNGQVEAGEEIDEDDDNYNYDYSHYDNYSGQYIIKLSARPKQKIQIDVETENGGMATIFVTMPNVAPKLKCSKVTGTSAKLTGTTKAGSKVTVKIGKKTYKGKANAKTGKFSIKIPKTKPKTKIKYNFPNQ